MEFTGNITVQMQIPIRHCQLHSIIISSKHARVQIAFLPNRSWHHNTTGLYRCFDNFGANGFAIRTNVVHE